MRALPTALVRGRAFLGRDEDQSLWAEISTPSTAVTLTPYAWSRS